MRNWMVLIAICLTGACAPVGAPSASPAGSSSATVAAASATPTASIIPTSTFTMPADPNMYEFFADQGSLIAYSSKDTPAPYDSKLQRADPATNTWRTFYQTDADFIQMHVAAGRMGLFEYREPPQGAGAFSVKIVVVDLNTGVPSAIDSYEMSAATYRGGGGAPRRPWSGLALGTDRIAWTRLIEGPNGSWRGELAFAPLSDPARKTVVASSIEWVAPLAIDSTRLVYVLGGKTEDELHVRDLASGADAIVARAAVGNTAVIGSPGMDYAVVVGNWAVWPANDPGQPTKGTPAINATIHALDLATGTERTFDAGGTYCPRVTAGSRYVAWYCGSLAEPNGRLLDAARLQPMTSLLPSVGVGVIASGDGLIWFRPPPGTREVTLFRPR